MREFSPIGVVTGMKFEAAILKRRQPQDGETALLVKVASADLNRAEHKARSLVDLGARALVSFGIAGGLSRDLSAGTLILPAQITDEAGIVYDADTAWNDRLAAGLDPDIAISSTGIVSVSRPVLSAEDKRLLAEDSGAGAVDMETFAVATVAREHQLPFIAIRAIADEADRDLPSAVQNAVGTGGSINIAAVLGEVIKSPGQIGDLIRLGRQNAKAKRTLVQVAQSTLPRFALA